jgi:hypothetical protein
MKGEIRVAKGSVSSGLIVDFFHFYLDVEICVFCKDYYINPSLFFSPQNENNQIIDTVGK